jgi:hypothetical protein
MQILHPFAGSVQQYTERLADPDCYRPDHCPQCQPNTRSPRTASTRARSSTRPSMASFACAATCATPAGAPSPLLPEFVLPYLRSSLMVIALFLDRPSAPRANHRGRRPNRAAADALPARPVLDSPLSRTGRSVVRRAGRADSNPLPRPTSSTAPLTMLQSTGWIAAHRFLFAGVRCHLLGWPRGLAPDGRRAAFSSAAAPA